MRKISVAFLVLLAVACNNSKEKKAEKETVSGGSRLESRLDEFMKANDAMDIDKVLDYTYPKLFDIVPRAQLAEAMKQGFDNEAVKVEMDSLKVEKIYPTFESGDGSYAKVDYSMIMIMTFKPGNETKDIVRTTMEEKYGAENVRVDESGAMHIRVKSPMVAAKDEKAKDWSFANIKEDEPMFKQLFSQDVIDKLAASK